MGARRDFMRAMLFGVVIGVAITTAFFQLRGGNGKGAASSATTGAASVPGAAGATSPAGPGTRSAAGLTPAQELAQLRARIAELEQAAAAQGRAGGGPDEDVGMSTGDDWWAALPPDPAWDDAREQTVIERVGKLGVKLDANQVECKRRCCRIAIDEDTYDELGDDLTSSVGLGFEPSGGMGTSRANGIYLVTKCWSRQPVDKPLPDRALERDALLAKVKGELDRCGQGTSPAVTLKLGLHLDDDGQIAKVDSNAKQLGQKAATCAETAILQAASFAASAMPTYVPLTVVLGK